MTRLIRLFGFLLMAAGALVVLGWMFEPLAAVWAALLTLPWPLQIGLGVAGFGLLLVFASLLWERFEERDRDRSLRDEP